MHQFTDSIGRSWSITVDPVVRTKVLEDTSSPEAIAASIKPFDLYESVNPEELARLGSLSLLVTVVFSICEEQAVAIRVSEEQFARGMTGDALESAHDALMGAIADFFPKRQRNLMKPLLAKGKEAADLAVERMMDRISKIDVSASVDKMLNESSGGSAALLESQAPDA